MADNLNMIERPPPKARKSTEAAPGSTYWMPHAGGPGRPATLRGASVNSSADASLEHLIGGWDAALETDAAVFWDRWSHLSHQHAVPTIFQSVHWLRDWYATLGALPHVEPILVRVFDRASQQDKLLLPLIRIRQSGLRVLAPPDLEVTDINSPLLQAGMHLNPRSAGALWKALRAELSRHGDLLRINKMPASIQGQPNPLALALTCRSSPCVGHVFEVGDCWQSWHRSLKRQARRESDRHWRVFQRYAEPKLERVTDPERAQQVLEQLEQMQLARMSPRSKYVLDQPAYRAFYRLRLLNGLRDGSVVLTAMSSAGQIMAAAYGVRTENSLTLLRVAFGGDEWKACAPGRLIMEHTARLLWEEGCRTFDLSIGSYAHKRTFGCSEYPLLDLCTPLQWRGIPTALAWHAKMVLRKRSDAGLPT